MGKGAKQKKKEGAKQPVPQGDQPPMKVRSLPLGREYIVLGAIVVIGLFLRFFELARNPLWLDEATTNFLAIQPDLVSVVNAAAGDHHAPLHFVTIWFIKFIGSSEFLLRLPSALAGTLTIIAVFFIAKELYDEDAGLIAAALLAVSPFHIYYSQEARMYGMVVLFVSLAVWMFLRAGRTGKLTDWLLFGGVCTLAFYTHFYSAFIIVALVAAYFILRFREFFPQKTGGRKDTGFLKIPHDLKNFACGLAISALLVLPLLGSFISQSGYFVSNSFNWGLEWSAIPSMEFYVFSDYSEILAILFFCLMLAGFALIGKRQPGKMLALAVIFFVPVLISMYISSIIPFNPRYLLYLIVLFLPLVALPLAWASGKFRPDYGTIGIVTFIILISAVPLAPYYTGPLQKTDWRTFSKNLVQATEPGDTIVPLPSYMYTPLVYYYNNATDGTFFRSFPLNATGFKSLDNTSGSVYFVVTNDINAADPTGYSVQYLKDHGELLPGSTDIGTENQILLLKKIS